MKIDIKHIAKLASLPVSEKEVNALENQLDETLKFVENLDEVDTKNVEATHSVTGLFNVMRDDETEPSLTKEQALQNAHVKTNGFFKVKAIFEEQ